MRMMTKRDIADIALLWIALRFFLGFLQSMAGLVATLCAPAAATPGSRMALLSLQSFNLLALLVCVGVLLLKRAWVLDRIFPDADQAGVALSQEQSLVLTDYAFWIRLLGVVTCLTAAIGAFSHLITALTVRREYSAAMLRWVQTGPQFFAVVLSAAVVWKAEVLAGWVRRFSKSGKEPAAVP